MAVTVIPTQWRALTLIAAMGMAALIAGAGTGGVAAQNQNTAPPSSGCTPALVSLSPCLSYITGNSNKPTKGCCSALETVVKTSPVCLCQLLGNNNPLGFPINRTRALALPGACDVKTPPVSRCDGAPATNPAASPGSGPVHSTPTASDGGNIPSIPKGSADGSSGGAAVYGPPPAGILLALFLAGIAW